MPDAKNPETTFRRGTITKFNAANKMGTIRPEEKGGTEVTCHISAFPEDQRHPEPKPGDSVEFSAPAPTKSKKGKPVSSTATVVKIIERASPRAAQSAGATMSQPQNEGPVPRWLPLYTGRGQKSTQTPRDKPPTAHTGLLFDKFCDVWAGWPNWKPEAPKPPNKGRAPKHRFHDEIAKHLATNSKASDLLRAYRERRKELLAALDGRCSIVTTDWRFVSGLGMGHVLETGFVWHRTLGVPYLPGSSVKGLLRAWADPAKGWGEEKTWEKVKHLFGDTGDLGAGRLIVFDALPVVVPTLDVDIMNPHYAPYYEKPAQYPPADYYSPRPIFFLAVAPGQSFEFALAPRPAAYCAGEETQAATDLAEGIRLLQEALATIGAGAKTAVGYGYFSGETV
jgi:CRISPR-associated protein Cmr6